MKELVKSNFVLIPRAKDVVIKLNSNSRFINATSIKNGLTIVKELIISRLADNENRELVIVSKPKGFKNSVKFPITTKELLNPKNWFKTIYNKENNYYFATPAYRKATEK